MSFRRQDVHRSDAAWLRVALAALLSLAAVAAVASEYALGPQDRIRITVVEWTLDELRSPISGEYTVGAGGDISLPLLGAVRAVGMPISEFSAVVSDLLQKKLALSQRPNTSVEVVQFRPFYIVGEVANPGEFAYRPGMTVLQAVSLAGGFPKPVAGQLQTEREMIAEHASVALLLAGIDGLLARRSRLEAELAGNETIEFPAEIIDRKDAHEISQIMATEETIFESRRAARALTVASEAQLGDLFREEQEALVRHGEALRLQLDSAATQLDMIRGLKERGLASPTRELDLERIVSEVQAKLWDVDTQGVRSRREFAGLQESNQRSAGLLRQQVANEMSETTAKLDELRNRVNASETLIRMTRLHSSLDPTSSYTIVREDAQEEPGRMAELLAIESTRIAPGDVLKVKIERGQPAAAPSSPAPQDTAPEAVSSRHGNPKPVTTGEDAERETQVAAPRKS